MPAAYVITADYFETLPDGNTQKHRATWVLDGEATLTDVDALIDLDGEYKYLTRPLVTITRNKLGSVEVEGMAEEIQRLRSELEAATKQLEEQGLQQDEEES